MKFILLCCFILFPAGAFAQGPLAPPTAADPATGPVPPAGGSGPQAAMKTLYQIEPRTPVQTLSSAPPYGINQPGSYYLTGNITVAAGDAITISADGVTLDLNGFTISSTLTGSASGVAISVTGNHSRLTVRNGSVVSGSVVPTTGPPSTTTGFKDAIYATGIVSQTLVSDMHFTGIGGIAVFLDQNGIIERCTATNCAVGGLHADEIRECNATQCYAFGIDAQANAVQCNGSSTAGPGVHAGANARDCVGASGTATGLQADGNAENCLGTASSGIGLSAGGNAMNCTGKTLGTSNSSFGIHCVGTANSCNGGSGGGASVALSASIAIGCTYSGTLAVPAGKAFNM